MRCRSTSPRRTSRTRDWSEQSLVGRREASAGCGGARVPGVASPARYADGCVTGSAPIPGSPCWCCCPRDPDRPTPASRRCGHRSTWSRTRSSCPKGPHSPRCWPPYPPTWSRSRRPTTRSRPTRWPGWCPRSPGRSTLVAGRRRALRAGRDLGTPPPGSAVDLALGGKLVRRVFLAERGSAVRRRGASGGDHRHPGGSRAKGGCGRGGGAGRARPRRRAADPRAAPLPHRPGRGPRRRPAPRAARPADARRPPRMARARAGPPAARPLSRRGRRWPVVPCGRAGARARPRRGGRAQRHGAGRGADRRLGRRPRHATSISP